MEWRLALALSPAVDIDTAGKEQFSHFDVARETREIERSISVQRIPSARVGTVRQEQFGNRGTVECRSHRERCSAVSIPHVRWSPAPEKVAAAGASFVIAAQCSGYSAARSRSRSGPSHRGARNRSAASIMSERETLPATVAGG